MNLIKQSALLVIDMQRYFLEPGADAYLEAGPSIIPNVKKLIARFRDAGQPVIYTRHTHKKGADLGQMGRWWNNKLPMEGDSQSELIADLEPQSNETVITKTFYSAFEKTGLEQILRDKNIDTVVICGVMTHLCVETTARHAFMLDFQPVVVSDACAAQSIAHHEATLLNLAHGFAHILKTDDVKIL